jgi:hypothetical protein
MRNAPNNRKVRWVFLAALSGVLMCTGLDAADFLFYWKPSADPSVSAYGIYQRTGDASYVKIDEVSVQDLDDSANPTYAVNGLVEGNTYWFAATAISGSGTEGDLSDKTCITVNGQIVECTDNDDGGATVVISCFIIAAGR